MKPMQPLQPQTAPPSLIDKYMGPGGLSPVPQQPNQLMQKQQDMQQRLGSRMDSTLSNIPAYQKMQAMQQQMQGRQPNPQEMQQLQRLNDRIENNPRMQQFQKQAQQRAAQFQQNYGSQLDAMRQQEMMRGMQGTVPYGGPMGPGQQGPGGPQQALDMAMKQQQSKMRRPDQVRVEDDANGLFATPNLDLFDDLMSPQARAFIDQATADFQLAADQGFGVDIPPGLVTDEGTQLTTTQDILDEFKKMDDMEREFAACMTKGTVDGA